LNRAIALHHLGRTAATELLAREVWAHIDYSRPHQCVDAAAHLAALGLASADAIETVRQYCVLDHADLRTLDAIASGLDASVPATDSTRA
jgi:hypothetical protein